MNKSRFFRIHDPVLILILIVMSSSISWLGSCKKLSKIPPPQLSGNWKLTSLNDTVIITNLKASILFNNDSIGGKTSSTYSYKAKYSVYPDNKMSFINVVSSRRDLVFVPSEVLYFKLLRGAVYYRVSRDTLTLLESNKSSFI